MELSDSIDLVFKIFGNASPAAPFGHKTGRWKPPSRDNSSARAKVLHGSMYRKPLIPFAGMFWLSIVWHAACATILFKSFAALVFGLGSLPRGL